VELNALLMPPSAVRVPVFTCVPSCSTLTTRETAELVPSGTVPRFHVTVPVEPTAGAVVGAGDALKKARPAGRLSVMTACVRSAPCTL
jgi:hypothetical protein